MNFLLKKTTLLSLILLLCTLILFRQGNSSISELSQKTLILPPHSCLAINEKKPLSHVTTRFFNGKLLRNHALVSEDLWVENGKIIAPQKTADVEIDLHGLLIAPGYIDLQINGGFGWDFSRSPEKVDEVSKKLPQFGVTAFLPTIISSSQEQYCKVLSQIHSKKGGSHGASILGIHLEGPFFSPKQCGAHNPKLVTSCPSSLCDFYGSLDEVKIVTLAPEIEGGFQAIEELCKKNITVSIGHSNATYDQTQEASKKGARLATHLFNAMGPFHHRDPGIMGAVLTNPLFFYSVIADGHHLHPATLHLAWHAHPRGLILVSDAVEALGLSPGNYHLGTIEVEVKEGKALVKGTSTLAGSILSLDAAVRNLQKFTGCSLVQAIESASLKPAQVLGLANKGSLEIGSDADFILLDDRLYVQACYIAGELAWKKEH